MYPGDGYRGRAKDSAKANAERGPGQSGKLPLHPQLKDNLQYISSELGASPDITIRQFEVGSAAAAAAIVYAHGICDIAMVNEFVLHSLMADTPENAQANGSRQKNLFEVIKANALSAGKVEVKTDWDGVILSVLSGDTVILIDGYAEAMAVGTRGGDHRGVEEPSAQVVIRGPKDGFVESIGTNAALVRRRIRSANLRLEPMQIGTVTRTDVAVMYIRGIASDKLVQEVQNRLRKINIDGILESNYIEQMVADKTHTPFPLLFNTERPDAVAGSLLEGRIAIFVDGTPFVLIAPATFFMFFQAAEDYYQHFIAASAIRLLRYISFLISLFVPSIYIAAITYHQEMIPTQLLISLAAQRENVPFPAFIEAFLMEVTFEILREAGIRMPRAIGQAVSIVGALVLGQAAVEAGIISSAMVIVVALTGIASFSTPSYSLALAARLIRFLMMVSAGMLGFYGVAIFSIIVLGHMCGLRSFGIPYLAPLAPFIIEDHKDTVILLPIKWLRTRPRLISQQNVARLDESGPPSPHNGQAGEEQS